MYYSFRHITFTFTFTFMKTVNHLTTLKRELVSFLSQKKLNYKKNDTYMTQLHALSYRFESHSRSIGSNALKSSHNSFWAQTTLPAWKKAQSVTSFKTPYHQGFRINGNFKQFTFPITVVTNTAIYMWLILATHTLNKTQVMCQYYFKIVLIIQF